MTMLGKYVDPPTTGVESSKGNFGLSYKIIFSKINLILKTGTPIMMNHTKAAKLLYVALGIEVKDQQFQSVPIGGLDALIVHDVLDHNHKDCVFDVAKLDNTNILFIFKDNLISEWMTTSEKFINLYSLYNALVAMSVEPGLCVSYNSIYSTIARYAPYVMTVKTLMNLGINVSIDDIDIYAFPEEDAHFINDESLSIIKKCGEEDLLSYGVLCDFAR